MEVDEIYEDLKNDILKHIWLAIIRRITQAIFTFTILDWIFLRHLVFWWCVTCALYSSQASSHSLAFASMCCSRLCPTISLRSLSYIYIFLCEKRNFYANRRRNSAWCWWSDAFFPSFFFLCHSFSPSSSLYYWFRRRKRREPVFFTRSLCSVVYVTITRGKYSFWRHCCLISRFDFSVFDFEFESWVKCTRIPILNWQRIIFPNERFLNYSK